MVVLYVHFIYLFSLCYKCIYVQFIYLISTIITITTIIIIQLHCFSLSCFIFLSLDNIPCMVKKHCMYKPVKIWRGHPLKNRLKPTQPCIELLTCLSVECTFLISGSIRCYCCYNQIWSRPICGSWITPSATKSVCFLVISIMITVNYKSSCLWPGVPLTLSNNMPK